MEGGAVSFSTSARNASICAFGFLESRDELFVLFVGLVELVAGLVQPTDFFFHRLDLDAKLFDFAILFVVPMHHVPALPQTTAS